MNNVYLGENNDERPIMVGLTGEDCLVAVIPPFTEDVTEGFTEDVDVLPSFHRRPVNPYVDNDVDTIIFGIDTMNF